MESTTLLYYAQFPDRVADHILGVQGLPTDDPFWRIKLRRTVFCPTNSLPGKTDYVVSSPVLTFPPDPSTRVTFCYTRAGDDRRSSPGRTGDPQKSTKHNRGGRRRPS